MKENKQLPKIGISIGDINGIGPEIILKTFENRNIFNFCIPIIYSSPNILNYFRKQLNLNDLKITQIKSVEEAQSKSLNVIDVIQENVIVQSGHLDPKAGSLAVKSLEALAKDLIDKKVDAGVTCPINKENVQNSGFKFPGQTEFFAQQDQAKESLMLLCSEQMKIGLVTGHVAIRDIQTSLNSNLIKSKLKMLINSLKIDFGITKPQIAVLGLNPHAGENGKIGKEELELINPIIEEFKNSGEFVSGPFPSDGLFGSGNFKKFDGILAMYHDQALIPFKMISFENGVNFTAGLKIIRTSPDHGTAFDIAGKGIASESSFRSALFAACDIWAHRKEISTLA